MKQPSDIKILVIGDSCEDIFVYGNCHRICPEAPVPVFNPNSLETTNMGMAGNVYKNVQALGYHCELLTNENRITKTRYIDEKSNQMLIRVDSNDVASELEDLDEKLDWIQTFDAVIVSDYDKGFLYEEDIEKIARASRFCLLDTKKFLGSWCKAFNYIKINQIEEAFNLESLGNLDAYEDQLVVTLGGAGCRYKDLVCKPTRNVQTIDVSGAGDTFMAAFATSMVQDKSDITKAMNFANECALKVIKQRGVATV